MLPKVSTEVRAPESHTTKHKLGLTVPLPAPLGFELDTAEF
ncbi:hypothetical protein [Streptomyces guryensis]|nr:hypothetical protein [Streptomyces guryensis]